MIFPPTVGPLWGSEIRAEILEGNVWRALKPQPPERADDSNSYCCPSLGLGNTAGAEILEGDVWRALTSFTETVRG